MPKQTGTAKRQSSTRPNVYAGSIVVDCLNGSALTPRVIADMHNSGVTALNLTAVNLEHDFLGGLKDLATASEIVAANPETLMLVRKPSDIVAAKQHGRVGIILGMQDGEPIERHLDRVRTLYDLGVRFLQLTHNRQNQIGTGCAETDSGLTQFGRAVVREMNRLGMIVDLSHCGPRTTLDAIEYSAVPVMCTHSNPYAISKSRRNKADDVIRALKPTKGLIGVCGWSPIVYRGNGKRPTLDDILDCVDYVADMIGTDHVVIGSDICLDAQPTAEEWARIYGGQGLYPEITGSLGSWYTVDTVSADGFDTMSCFPRFVDGLSGRGYADEAIGNILGGNFMRLFEAVTAFADTAAGR